ncbi:MAG TPA: rod shape-determining protein MreC [Chitinophagales bacterium]|nr:rod shape-determining protein MreC [Chitinophagales bacterium]
MRNLFSFIYYYRAFFLFLVLELFCVALMVQNSGYQRAAFLNISDEVVGRSFAAYSEVTGYLRLGEHNKELAMENAQLRNNQAASFYQDSSSLHIKKDTSGRQFYSYTPAEVVQTSTNRINNYIIINKGRDQGIAPRMAVISPTGIVGIVKNVSDHFSSLYSLLHSQVTVSARVRRDGSRGTIKWDGESPYFINLEEITRQEQLHNGDTIFTSGVSRIFPDDIPIGTIDRFSLKEPGNFYEIRVRLTADFKKLDYVYVVNNLMSGELDSLINKTENVQ